MSQLIVMNKENGAVSLGIRIQFFDKVGVTEGTELCKMEGHTITFRDNSSYDGWLLFSGEPEADGTWVYADKKMIDSRIEVLGEL